MRWSKTLIPTLKEVPAEAEILSHQLLLRAGLVRKLTGGLYTFLPLGVRVLHKIERIVREEMDRAGALEVLMPALQPPDIWRQSGRYETASEVLYKARDRADKEWVLGPTHEEVITTLVGGEIRSYRQLPKNFYQIQTKFRDEIRPRFGLMRAKEFVMKDAYSFDATDEGAQESYRKMFEAYVRIFARCGLKAVPVEADTGVMGGKFSHEFMVPAETGENEMVYCPAGDYAANIDKATSQGTADSPSSVADEQDLRRFPTPNVTTIEALAQPPYGIRPDRQIKTLVYWVEDQPVLVLLRGDHQLSEAKLAACLGTTTFRPATAEEVVAALGAHPGSLGGVGVASIPIWADETLRGAAGMTTGANEDGYHFAGVKVERDLRVKAWADLRVVQAGEACPVCGKDLKIRRAIEVGHVFKLGTKYSTALGALFLDEKGRQTPAIMGCYGIGVTRTFQAIIEQSNDKDGIVWPWAVAPYRVVITPLNVEPNGEVMRWAEKIYTGLGQAGIDALLDDRDERPGVKFKDSELIGFPLRVVIGDKSLRQGELELKPRGQPLMTVQTEEALDRVMEWARKAGAGGV